MTGRSYPMTASAWQIHRGHLVLIGGWFVIFAVVFVADRLRSPATPSREKRASGTELSWRQPACIAAIVGSLVYLFVVENVIAGIPATASAYKWLPGGALRAVASSGQPGPSLLHPWQGGLLLLGYGLVAAVIGTLLTVRRDIT